MGSGSVHILYPAFAMFALVFAIIMRMGWLRFHAIRGRKMSIKYYTTYQKGEEPENMRILTRHVINQFEVPVLFYVGVVLVYITLQVSPVTLAFAWAFVGFRYIHSFIHLTDNNVSRRFFAFGLSLISLLGLWLSLFLQLTVL